jgi:mannitol/fructose-specific phosphotransferase system IIA component (Ntr-type)
MKSLLNALQEGRLIELPDTDKGKSLEYLANLIEAVPDLPSTPELYEAMMAREKAMNTSIGKGVACPHVRAPGNGELLCAVGWSPVGIDYGAPDGKKVHLVVMYYIPEAQKNVYLKEISALAGAVRKEGGIQPIATAQDIATVRERLLDWVSAAIEASIPEAKARMIRLESRQAVAETTPLATAGAIQIVPVSILALPEQKPVVLSQQPELVSALEKDERLGAFLQQNAQFDSGGFRLVPRSTTQYPNARSLYDYWAVKLTAPPSAPPPPSTPPAPGKPS